MEKKLLVERKTRGKLPDYIEAIFVITKEQLRKSGFMLNNERFWQQCPPKVEITFVHYGGESIIRYCFDFNEEGVPLPYHANDMFEFGPNAEEMAMLLLYIALGDIT